MTEREKVLNDLQELCEYLFHEYKVCYKGDEEDTYNRFLAANNALELLKEQKDTVQRVNIRWEMGIHGGNCPKCLNWVQLSYNYCPFCGAKMDEEGK